MTNVKAFELRKETVNMIREDIRASEQAPDDCSVLEKIVFFVIGPQINDQLYLGSDGYSEDFAPIDWPCPEEQALHSISMQITRTDNCCYHKVYADGVTKYRKICW